MITKKIFKIKIALLSHLLLIY